MNSINPTNQIPNLTTAQKAMATTIARSLTLLSADGYTIEPYADCPGVYSVARPEADKRPLRKGETLWNDVDILNQDCTCECFRFRGTCKHLLATNKAVAEAARLMAPMLPTQAQTPEAAWPPVDRAEKTAFTPRKRFAEMTPEERRRQVAADFG